MAVAGVAALVLAGTAPVARAASVASAVFSGSAGTYATSGTLFAKQGAALTLTLITDATAQCVEVIDGGGATIATQTSDKNPKSNWQFSGASYPWLTAGSGSGSVTYTTKAWKGVNPQGKCTANGGEIFGLQSASYLLDNSAPTATATLAPAPNALGWNRSNVTVTWTGTDGGGSGVKSLAPASETVSADGATSRTTTVTDNVGNIGSASVQVKLDKTAPIITGSRTPAANADGWNNSDVTVSFTPGDDTSGVKTSSAPTTLTTSAANQSVTGSVTDNADNTASTTVSGINIDKVAPTLTGVRTTPPNAAGWYRGDVTVVWTATDALSGTSSPANSTITGEGTALTATSTATDRAGNSTGSVQTPPVKIDRTAPNTTVTAPPAWNNTDLTLTLVPTDGLSGVAQTFYELDGGATVTGTSVPVTSEGNHSLKFWSSDAAGNTEAAHTVSFGIDKTSPTIGHTQSPAANADGWNKTDVTLTFTCSDAVSGVASCTGPQDVSTEGKAQTVTGTVRDNAGNTANDPATVSIDKTKPVITVDALPTPNANGWYGDDVTATYTASDALSGIKTQDRSHTFGEGAAQTDTATATDIAGNSASVTTSKVSVDKTAPTISGTVVSTPNANGWFSDDVTVHWTCDDNLSGVVACPSDSVVTGEGSGRSASASTSDQAGHTATATVGGIKIDRSKPSTSATGVPGGWVNAPVTIGLHAIDNLSDIDSTYYAVDGASPATKGNTVTVGTEGVHSVRYWSVDNAGNAEAAQTFAVKVDLSSPTIVPSQEPGQNANGWNNTDVAVSFACDDQAALSGLRSCSAPVDVATEGKGQTVTGTATDNAGNSISAAATVNIDKTPPTITGATDRAANAAGWYSDDVTVSFNGKDSLSGIDTVTGPQHLGEGADQQVDGTAVDNAGNSASATVDNIDIDKTAPDLSAAPTTEANDNGWYKTDVTQMWNAVDTLSGLAGGVPAPSVLSTEGRNLTASASVADNAGNTTTATSEPVQIDKTAPLTRVTSPAGWVNAGLTLDLIASDALSGVKTTRYSVDGEPGEHLGTNVSLTTEGEHTVTFYSTDLAGNDEPLKSVVVKIDKTAPTITHSLAPAANPAGWNRADVTVTFTCKDQEGLSGIATCSAPELVDHEVTGQRVTGTATDNAGNEASDEATVNLDKTKPTITGSRAPLANASGWNKSDVTVHFAVGDERSGVADSTADTTLGEGTDQSLVGTVRDAAGNADSTTVGGINVDKTAPTLAGKPSVAPNGNGWYKGDVTVEWTAADDRSGVAATPADSTITGEGTGLKATTTVADVADNSTTSDSVAVNIDRTAPTTGANAPAGWNNSAVTVSLTPADGLSGVDATYYAVDGGARHEGTTLTIAAEGVHTLSYWSVDLAGNTEAVKAVTVKIDLTRPTIGHTVVPAPNALGWNKTPVTVAYQCTDALSGVATCSPEAPVSLDGADQAVPGTAVDNAGNTQTDHAKVSIDTVKPTITGAPDRGPNTNHWYAGNVTVSFSCGDALSGIAACSSPVTVGEGKEQAAKGTATDTAGNTADVTVAAINVDKTAPILSGAPTTDPVAEGWYRGDVTVRWTAQDALSGLDGAAPADTIIDGEGRTLTSSASVHDLAGNETSAKSAPVKIDRTAPSTTVSNVSDWSNKAVTVELTAGDNLSGVAATYYQLDDEPAGTGSSVTIGAEGVHTLKVWSVDVAGNVEAHKNLEVKIDKTAPGISHSQAPAANARLWNNSDVTVTFTCTDTGSGIASCTSPVTKGEGAAQKVQGTATDRAGNSAPDEATVNVDKTKPTVSGSLSAEANAKGWFKADVTATFTCADQDGLSGILSCPAAKTLGEGRNQSAGGTATDAADNPSVPFSITGIDVDKTDPTLSGAATTAPNDNGWYRGDVTVKWTAEDALSGLDGEAPADTAVTGEGDDLASGASVSDKAGNVKDGLLKGIKIDRHAPSTTATAPSGWQSADVTVKLVATDNLSGVAGTYYAVDGGTSHVGTETTVSTEGTHQVTYWSVDEAGNTETARTVTVLLDKGAPTITGAATTSPNGNGWYKTPVVVHFTCDDAVSGIASCQPDAPLAAQGPNSAKGTAVDNAGNTASTTLTGINIDTVAPVVTIGGVADGATYTLGAVPTPTATATDATSGLGAPAAGLRSGGTTNGVGTFTYTATATDKAGNGATATVSYRVVYGFGTTLFLQPVNDTAHQTGVATSVFNAGQAIPMKFQLRTANGTLVQAGSAPRWLTPVKGSATTAAVNEAAYAATATTGGTYVWDGTQYQYNWKTDKTMAGSYWRVGVALDDGQTYYVNIALR